MHSFMRRASTATLSEVTASGSTTTTSAAAATAKTTTSVLPMTASEPVALMHDLIPVVNRLQDVIFSTSSSMTGTSTSTALSSAAADPLDLPQIVVVGSQSSGKSSVLENICQRDFLPRGKDIVTRRPLILQLIHAPNTPNEYAEFLHLPDSRFSDFNLVRREIEAETDRVAGQNKGISRKPIHLRIYSQHVLNLTLVDLPGITKIPIGDQPPDIEKRIRKLVMEFVSKPNAIILAVTPANQDIVNSEALKLAREVDPEGARTIGVLTKLDLMDAGTNAYDILTGRAFPLKLGFIGVVNRSQQDIMNSVPIAESLRKEVDFFRSHPAYKTISNRCGTAFLAKTLNSILMAHIREKLPDIKSKLNLLIVQTEQELSNYGDLSTSIDPMHHSSLVLRLITQFAVNFNASIDGTFSASTSELTGGARLYYIFNSIYGQALQSIDPLANLSSQDIRTAIRNSTGARPALFIPEAAFELLVKPLLKRLEVPGLRCVELVFDELMKIVTTCETKEMHRFPKLHQRVVEVAVEMLRERMAPTQAYIESLISIQLAYINTNHPDFIGGGTAIQMLDRKQDRRRVKKQTKPLARSTLNDDLPPMDTLSLKQEHQQSVPTTGRPSHPGNGKDGGFLTYFFGGGPHNEHNSQQPAPIANGQASIASQRDDFSDAQSELVRTATVDRQPSPTPPPHFSTMQSASHHHYSNATDKEDFEIDLIRSLLTSYFNITRKTIADLVPKTIMHLMVNSARENLQNRLVSTLYHENVFQQLLVEDERIMRERTALRELVDGYKRAANLLRDIF